MPAKARPEVGLRFLAARGDRQQRQQAQACGRAANGTEAHLTPQLERIAAPDIEVLGTAVGVQLCQIVLVDLLEESDVAVLDAI
ncbi:hypothetical protein [Streptomyces cadmiisoli]|uniref:Uncharacterized protein n=1 Tax=Streptomyces cadmiisoli TaxID=2184053 RepID=A0A2Z4JAH3_9ACTN|nr:hypothetical protein [Streptomyces cadmiisoli]AWW41950.1 hypothetical protein DN051_39450 [Streptomyces cadmiisoli]